MLCTARALEGEEVGLEDGEHSRGGVVGRRVDKREPVLKSLSSKKVTC